MHKSIYLLTVNTSGVYCQYRYGQLSGMVEPLAGLFGAVAVVIAQPLLPYTLAFAAGAMIYVVFDDIIPEAQASYVVCHSSSSSSSSMNFMAT